jgi:hypothetical protein
VRGQFQRVSGAYPKRPINLFLDRAYTQTEYNVLGGWNATGKLVAHGRIGYVQRENDNLSQRNFSGFTGRLSADYFPTGKTALNGSIYRELGNADDVNASYQLSSGISLGAAWRVRPKLTLHTSASFENRSFEGDTGFVLATTPRRDEDTTSGSLSLSYTPVPMATVDVGVQAGRRDSNVTANEYAFRSVFVNLRADF